jgi:hypothetical protein
VADITYSVQSDVSRSLSINSLLRYYGKKEREKGNIAR